MPEHQDTIDRMRSAIQAASDSLGARSLKYRLHPSDYQALRTQCEPWLRFDSVTWMPPTFEGVLIVEDEQAAPLPRKNILNVKT